MGEEISLVEEKKERKKERKERKKGAKEGGRRKGRRRRRLAVSFSDLRHSDSKNSSDQVVKFIYATRAML